jgi:5-aminolevulinate synthase
MYPMDYPACFDQAIETIKQENRYRVFNALERNAHFPKSRANGREVVSWCGVDYLGLTQNPVLKDAFCENVKKYGTGSGGTRNIGGTHVKHVELEQRLAKLHHQEAALLFTSGYVANQTALATLGALIPNMIIFSDAENHMSIIDGIRESRCQKIIFNHNNMADLEQKLATFPLDQPKLIVAETVYSMSGDFAPLKQLIALAKQYHALTYVDEVHATGVYGQNGGGLTEAEGVASQIDFIQGTLGKSFGLLGGYLCGKANSIDAIRSLGKGFIFTVSLPPAICATAIDVLDYLETHHDEQHRLLALVQGLKQKMRAANLPVMGSPSQIIPVWVGNPKHCKTIADTLFNEHGIYIQTINYPTVRKGEERLRISPTALHTIEQADQLIEALIKLYKNCPQSMV